MDVIKLNPFDSDYIFDTAQVEAFWTNNLPAIRHQVGFTGSAGHLLLRSGATTHLFVDGRYTLQAASEAPDVERSTITMGFFEDVAAYLQEHAIKRVAFDANSFTYREWQKANEACGDDIELVPFTENLMAMRMVKSEEEIAIMKEAIEIADVSLQETLRIFMRPNVTEKEFAWALEKAMRDRGAEKLSFDTIVAGGENAAIIHATPTDRIFNDGEVVLIDYGMVYKGYCTDRTDTVVLGTPSDEMDKIYNIVEEAHDAAIAAIKPGMTTPQLDAIARKVIDDAGYGEYFSHSLGHGVGLEIHEYPVLSPRAETVLEPGMIVTVEPGIYLEGKGGVRIEDMVLVTEDGFEQLTPLREKGIRSFSSISRT